MNMQNWRYKEYHIHIWRQILDILDKYCEISSKVKGHIKKDFDVELVHNDSYLKTKI